MKKIALICLLFIVVFYSQSCVGQKKFSTPIHHSQYEGLWNEVKTFEGKRLPKSALKIVESIYSKAQNDQNTPQTVKALLFKSKTCPPGEVEKLKYNGNCF